uniref:Uncharacterized protein n=1 Tax=Paracidobacterium acidisoli TaxID=2303751 RepID=A0A372IIV6_9BACT
MYRSDHPLHTLRQFLRLGFLTAASGYRKLGPLRFDGFCFVERKPCMDFRNLRPPRQIWFNWLEG